MAGKKEKDFSNFSVQNFKSHEPTANLPEKESSTEKAPASDVFSGVLESKEKKTERMQILLTKANRKILEEYSKKTGNSKNDIINRLISALGENTDL